ncbi:hypothetical protein HGRIS_010046 [Hohenbuehelia grisea]|uniref:Oxidoreductase AflY n=1 Tax=Hohenbuehelia grisea TaxID=104357 RepID=A0ABR3J3G2_9AGAR
MASVVSYAMRLKGALNIPGTLASSKTLVEELLRKDADEHHCYFRSAGLHNHLSHHLLAAYDLGAPAGVLQKIYDIEVKSQRPIFVEEKHKDIVVTQNNWTQYLGKPDAYGSYVKFFKEIVASAGVKEALENYVFSPDANQNGAIMLVRLMSGALHPFIQVGYGLEFGNSALVVTGLAQTAVHKPITDELYDLDHIIKSDSSSKSKNDADTSVLGLLREVYDSSILHPAMPYDPDALVNQRLKSALQDGRGPEIKRICSQYTLADESPESAASDIIWAAVILLCSTGRHGRAPRLDFFLMHLVTSSIFFRAYFNTLREQRHKAAIVKAYLPGLFLFVLARGRPRIDATLLMSSTATPRPPQTGVGQVVKAHEGAIGSPSADEDYNPWPAILSSAIYAPDAHTIKTARLLAYAAREFGDVPAGGARGAFLDDGSKESHPGMAEVDGSIFVRAAGMVMDYMGWVSHGQKARPDWDRSALGWDEAWNGDEE